MKIIDHGVHSQEGKDGMSDGAVKVFVRPGSPPPSLEFLG